MSNAQRCSQIMLFSKTCCQGQAPQEDWWGPNPGAGVQGAGAVPGDELGRLDEDHVEIGANATVDRAFLGETRIGTGTKIDNLVHVGHNSRLGKGVVIAAQTGLSGSVTVGDHAVMGGQVGVVEHTHIGAGARIGAQSGVTRDVEDGASVLGTPADAAMKMKRLYARLRQAKDPVD